MDRFVLIIAVYAFEVTQDMFDFMEPRFEKPTAAELKYGVVFDSEAMRKN